MSNRAQWFAVVDGAGRCQSIGTAIASPMPPGLSAIRLADEDAAALLDGTAAWSPSTRGIVPIPQPVPEVTTDQIRAWMAHTLGMTAGDIDNAFREAARIS